MSRDFITPSYTFTPGASGAGTVNLSGISSFNVKRLAAIINQTRGVTIFATGVDSLGYTQVSGTTLTLATNTNSHSASDTLVIIYDSAEQSLISDTAPQTIAATPIRQVGGMVDVAGFSASGDNVLDSFFVQTPVVTGVAGGLGYTQSSGSLAITSGTTANAEFLARSVKSYRGSMRMRFSLITSARNTNSNLAVMQADLLGESLPYTISSSSVVSVTLNAHSFTSLNVGQFVNIAGITGAAGVPGRYAISSIIDANTIQFNVGGAWPPTGTGTCTLFGRNYIRNLVTGTTATQLAVDAQRNGWATGDTTATINTTASPGTLVHVEVTGREVFWFDQTRASTASSTAISRASRTENIPDATTDLFVFLWCFNGTTGPATTTYTLGHLSIESFPNNSVYLQGVRSNGSINALPTLITSGTVTTVAASNTAIPLLFTDITTAAITSNSTTATVTPTAGCSYIVSVPVTAVSGTAPTLDINIDESDDSGTNWVTVYSFPRITATGSYRSPKLSFTGNRVRYVQTVTGTNTPSFTRGINRLQCSDAVSYVRQLIDRTISLTTLNSVTPRLVTQNCSRVQLVVLVTAATTAPTLQLQGSDDNFATWYPIGTLPAVANSTTPQTLTVADVNAQMLRAMVTGAGTGVTMGYVLIKAF